MSSTETPTLTIFNTTTGKWEVYLSKEEVARRADRKAASRKIWAAAFPDIIKNNR